MMPAAMASRTRWNDRATCLLCSLASIRIELLIIASLSPNIKETSCTGTPKYLNVVRKSMACSVHIRPDTNSDPYVAVSTVDCFLEYQPIGVWLTKCKIPVTERPVNTWISSGCWCWCLGRFWRYLSQYKRKFQSKSSNRDRWCCRCCNRGSCWLE